MNTKQIKYTAKKVINGTIARQNKSLFCLFACIAVVLIAMMIFSGADGVGTASGLTSLASFMAIGNIYDVTDLETTGDELSYEVVLISHEQWDLSKPFPTASAREITTPIPLKSGEKAVKFFAHSVPSYKGTGEKGDITVTGNNEFTFLMGGFRSALLDFCEQYVGGKFLVLFREKEAADYQLIGTFDRPCDFKSYEANNGSDGRYVSFTFSRTGVKQPVTYSGTLEIVPDSVPGA